MEAASPSGASGYRELGQAQFGGQILITLRISASAQRLSACLERRKRILQRRFYRCSSGAACSDECSSSPGVRFDLSLGVAYALDAVPMNLLSVSALMKEGATVHFEKGNSWLQHPDMPTRIMMEERRGLFVLPSSNRVQSLYLTTKGSVLLGSVGLFCVG